VGGDQVTKSIARDRLASLPTIHLLGDLFRFQFSENTGAFMGLGADLPDSIRFWAFVIFAGAVLIGLLLFLWTTPELTPMSTVGGLLATGGGLSNLIDRLYNDGMVVDFMNMGIGRLRTGIFNVADVAIMVGIGMLLVGNVFFRSAGDDPEAGNDLVSTDPQD
jgi:signal peptidase II